MTTATPVSNEVRLPRPVQRQLERVRAIEKAAAEAESGSGQADDATPPATPSAVTPAPTDGPKPPAPANGDPRHADPAYWAQRFRAVDGILKKERSLHQQEVEGLHQRIVELEEENATLKAQPSTSSSSTIDLGKYFTPEQIERIGEDEAMSMAQAAEKAAQAAVDAALNQVEATLKPEREQRRREHERLEAQKYRDFVAALEAEVPDLHELDKNQAWLDWLDQQDGNSAFTRQETLDRHKAALDASALIKMVAEFKASVEVPAPPIPPSGDTTRSEVPTVPGGKPAKVWTPALVKDYYKRAALNRVTPEERTEFEAWYATTRPSRK